MMEGMVKSNKIGQSAAKSLLVREKGSETISKESTPTFCWGKRLISR